jgi:hypothetical protein
MASLATTVTRGLNYRRDGNSAWNLDAVRGDNLDCMLASPSLLLFAVLAPPEPSPAQPEHVEIVAAEPAPQQPIESPIPAPGAAEPEPTSAPAPTPTLAPEPAPEPRKTWQAEIFIDVYFAANSNSPDNHIMRGYATTPRSGEFVPGVLAGFIRHRATDEEPWWLEVGLHAGANVDSLVAAEPIAGGDNGRFAGVEVFKHLALANAGFRIRKSKTTIGGGVFESPFGLSFFWSYRGAAYTPMWHNHLVPYYLIGAQVTQEITPGLTFSAWLVNGGAAYSDNNKAPSGVGSLTWSPAPRKRMQALTIASHVLFGPEGQSIAPEDWYILSDTWITWAFDEHFSMGAAWDFAIENPGRAKAEQNLYTGGGVYARGTVLERGIARMDIVLRPEALWDRDGRFFGVPQWLITPSAEVDLALWQSLIFRVQYRYDYSTSPDGFFYRGAATTDGGPGLVGDQHTVFFALTGLWDFWFGRHKARD